MFLKLSFKIKWFTEVQHKKHEAKKRRKSTKKRRTLHRTPKKENTNMEDKENLEPVEIEREIKTMEHLDNVTALPRPPKRAKMMIEDRPSITMTRLAQLARPKVRLTNPDFPERIDFRKSMRKYQPVKRRSHKTTQAISPKLRTARRQRRLQVLNEDFQS